DTTATITFRVVNDVNIDFTFDLDPGCEQDTVHFTNLSEPGSYWWNFADGTTPDDTNINPTHIYQNQDEYNVRLTVRNLDRSVASMTILVLIRQPLNTNFTLSHDS